MRFTFNMGQNDAQMQQMIEDCKKYFQCEGCPIMEKGGLRNPMSGNMYSCSTAIIRNIQKKNGKV